MSVDLSILVRHDFHDTDDPVACVKFMEDTIAGLQKYFLSEDITDDVRYDDEYSFYLKPIGNIRVCLHKGCWEFETCFGYGRYFLKDENSRNPLRILAYDLARAFGKAEVWVTDEHHGWFGCLEDVSNSFEEWLASPSNMSGWSDEVLEYNPDDFPNINDWNYNYGPKYHDSLKWPKEHLRSLEKRFPEYRFLTCAPSCSVILGAKDNRLYALDIVNSRPFVDYPIDGINDGYNTVAVEIYKDGESALFNSDGAQLTSYGSHDFSWSWERGEDRKVRVTDNKTGEYWTFDL